MIFSLLTKYSGTLYIKIARLDWEIFFLLGLLHMLVTFLGLWALGEAHLVALPDFIYYYATTASTIGYGDLSPVSGPARLFAALWLFPGALLFFTVFLAKITTTATNRWRRKMDGHGDFRDRRGHTLIVGYHAGRTQRMLQEVIAGGVCSKDIILVSSENAPIDKSRIAFVLAADLTSKDDLIRAGAPNAERIIVFTESDDATLAASLAVASLNKTAHLVSYFEDRAKADLLEAHTHAVCVVSQSAEIVVREMQDPGVSSLFTDLSSARTNVTIFSLDLPGTLRITASYGHSRMRSLGATFIGVKCARTDIPQFNLDDEEDIGGKTIFYVASQRIALDAFLNRAA